MVKHNYGLDYATVDKPKPNKITFYINNRKKFLLKIIKYGIN